MQLWSHAAKWIAAAKWLSIITVDVLPMAGSVGSILIARAHHHWRLAVLAQIVAAALRCTIRCVGTRARGGQRSIDTLGAIDGCGPVRVRANINLFSGLQTARARHVVASKGPALYRRKALRIIRYT